MSLVWREAKGYYQQSGIIHDSPDLDEDPDFDHAFDHATLVHSRWRHPDLTDGTNCPGCKPEPQRFDLSQPLHGNETILDPAQIDRYTNDPEHQGHPLLLKYKGEHHIIDGHHRLIARRLRGDSHAPVHLYDGDHLLAHPEEHSHDLDYAIPPREDEV